MNINKLFSFSPLPDYNRWFEIVVEPLLNEENTLIGAVHIMSDITERRKNLIQIRRAFYETLET